MKDNIHRTVFELVVLSEGPLPYEDLSWLAGEIDYGASIGDFKRVSSEVVRPEMVEVSLLAIGNDGSFFDDLDIDEEDED